MGCTDGSCAAFGDEEVKEVVASLEGEGFEPYVTSVGGGGLGILAPDQGRDSGASVMPAAHLADWASGRGRWLYS